MPFGKGTYGSKVGRPPKNKKQEKPKMQKYKHGGKIKPAMKK